jgi:hypothetical protein
MHNQARERSSEWRMVVNGEQGAHEAQGSLRYRAQEAVHAVIGLHI